MHGRRTVFIEARLGIVDVVAGQFDFLLDEDRLRAARGHFLHQLVAGRRDAGNGVGQFLAVVFDHAHFEGGGAAEDVLGLGRVLYARQLDHDAVGAGLLDDRFGHAQFVHAVVQGGDVLADGVFLHLADFRFGEGGDQAAGVVVGAQGQVGQLAGDDVFDGLEGGFVTGADFQRIAGTADLAVADLLGLEFAADVAGVAFQRLVDGGFHVDFQQEVHAAAQVKAEEHRVGLDRGEPGRGRGEQVQCDDVMVAQCLLDGIAGLELFVGAAKAHLEAAAVKVDAVGGKLAGFQQGFHLVHQRCVDRIGAARAGNLHRRAFAVEVRYGVDRTDDQGQCNDQVLPKRIAVHGRGCLKGNRTRRTHEGAAARETGLAFVAALFQLVADGGALELDFNVLGDFHRHVVVVELGDAADHAGLGHDFVAFLQGFEHGLVFLHFLLLRANQQEPEEHEDDDHGQERHQLFVHGGSPGRVSTEERGIVTERCLAVAYAPRARWAWNSCWNPAKLSASMAARMSAISSW